jgi:osmotically-inducible protein OsmY
VNPTPARTTPTPAPSPRPVPPRNVNFRLPTNSVVGPVNRPPEEEIPDWQIKAQIEKRMTTHDQLSGVKVDVVKGVVTLSGTVPDADWRSTAQMLSKIKGVKGVRNDLKHN